MAKPGTNDIDVWSSFKMGDDRSLSFIYEEYAPRLYHYGVKFTSDVTIIEDSIQDLFSNLIKLRHNLGDTDNILFYLLKSFKRILLKRLQKDKHHDVGTDPGEYAFDMTFSIEHDIIVEEIESEKLAMVRNALKSLTNRQKEAIYLRFAKDLAYEEIADIMNISVEACRNLIYTAIKSLKSILKSNKSDSILLFLRFMVKNI